MKSSTLVLSVSSPMPPTPIKLRPVPKYSPTSTTFSSPNHSSRRLKMTIKNDRGIDGLEFFGPDDMRVFTLPELFRSSAELLGKGSVGSTYKAYLESGVEVIVKRLRNVSISEREFRWKVEEIGWLVHENLLPLIGYFYGGEEKLVIFQAMPSSGSLSSLLHGNKNKALSWESRMKIALETAQGIEYIHSTGPQAAHGNVKSSNIFITKHSTARISEFGLTQLVFPAPTINAYRPPKSATDKSGPNSQSADVYSFGVTLLELLTGRSPDYALMSEGIKLPDWVRSVVQEKGPVGAFDRALVRCDVRHQMERLLDVAMDCTMWNPESRPSMVEITGRIREI